MGGEGEGTGRGEGDLGPSGAGEADGNRKRARRTLSHKEAREDGGHSRHSAQDFARGLVPSAHQTLSLKNDVASSRSGRIDGSVLVRACGLVSGVCLVGG